jgi:phage shock protein PspC (stress-responsive transcriptional regulator)
MAPSTDDMTDSDHTDAHEPDPQPRDARTEQPGSRPGEPLPPPTVPLPPSRPPLRRATFNKEWLGVAEGFSRYLGVSVGFVRLAFVITTFLGGLGFVVYLLAAALIPKDGESNALGDRLTGGRSELLLVLIGALALSVVGILNSGDSDLAVIGVLALAGFALWAHSNGSLTTSTFARTSEVSNAGVPPTSQYAPWTAVASGAPPAAPAKPRKSARLGLATLALSVLAMIVLAPWSSVWRVVWVGYIILGVGLLAGWILRKRVWFLLLPLVALAPVLPAAAFYSRSGVPLNAGVGEVTLTPGDLGGTSPYRRLSAGHITIDLSTLTQSRTLQAAVGAGQIDIVVPKSARLMVRARAGAGNIRVLGVNTEGTEVRVDRTVGGNENGITIEIDARVGMGLIDIHTAEATA